MLYMYFPLNMSVKDAIIAIKDLNMIQQKNNGKQ